MHHFNSLCTSTIDEVGPFRSRVKGIKSLPPWITDDIVCFKRECSRVMRGWRKTRLQVHYQQMKDLMASHSDQVKNAKKMYFSVLIQSNKHSPRVLFNINGHFINPVSLNQCGASHDECLNF